MAKYIMKFWYEWLATFVPPVDYKHLSTYKATNTVFLLEEYICQIHVMRKIRFYYYNTLNSIKTY